VLGKNASAGLVFFRIDGGAPLLTEIKPTTVIGWSRDGKHLFVMDRAFNRGKAYVLPLATGHLVPENIVHGLPPDQEILKLPGARLISSGDVALGPTADIYAFTRESVQRNLYRVPVP
jgi:hypothetical protein